MSELTTHTRFLSTAGDLPLPDGDDERERRLLIADLAFLVVRQHRRLLSDEPADKAKTAATLRDPDAADH